MEFEDFKKSFIEEVKTTATIDGEGSAVAFINIVADYFGNSEILFDINHAYFKGVGKRNKKIQVDAHAYDQFDQTFSLIIANYLDSDCELSLTQSDAIKQFDRLLYFLKNCIEPNFINNIDPSNPVSDLINLIKYNLKRNKINKFKFYLLTDQPMSKRIKSLELLKFNNIPIECQIWDIDRIYNNCTNIDGKSNIEIDFDKILDSKGIPCIEAKQDGYNSYLGILPGSVVADLYDKYGSQLLEGNVRSFLSTKVAVNKKIRETILKNPENFFAFNNGIAATAHNIKLHKTVEGAFIYHAEDFQIINGGQTTASLSNSRFKDKADLSKIFVQIKLTEIDSNVEKATEFIRMISKSSNSQSKVSDVDFFSTHPFHVRMEQISKRLYAPSKNGEQFETKWFYERARGQFIQAQMHMKNSEKKLFLLQHPKKQLVTKPLLAKARNSWNQLPHVVSKGAQSNFLKFAELIDKEWSKNENLFNDKYYKDSISLIILFQFTETLVSHQDWYEGGYRANIVTYSIALLSYLLTKQYKTMQLDFSKIWNEQKVSWVIEEALITISKFVYFSIINPSRQTVNVTQWCKRESCWNEIKTTNIILNENIKDALILKENNKEYVKDAVNEQKIYSDIEVQSKILSFEKNYWIELDHFLYALKINLTSKDINILNIAKNIPRKIPSPLQSRRLIELINIAESNGFKHKK